ncbi:(2Fe-2S)-binding protein [Streptomyces cellostaticus]|uniref:(2Fe-2S)-binding protein n=1 Tax=Streptomyces cellostaticus TaxID=67285 RepID=A0A117PW45_9ACTN|nr:2Fe-2S iron-sulfur cluster-binding protein [Streptomyces cellostaticus]KUM94643.1 (2Fe-2S)-binding protein [Streptomyces cellostaticus]GHI07328.1 hypothetical protein Scel_56490 [Streptomyces cellostaticus]
MTDDQHGEGTPQGGGRWNPLPQGDYDDGATAFVKLPEGGIDALLSGDSPLAAPGHGYVPPRITATGGTDDPAATGTWAMPADGHQWPDPNAVPQEQAADDRFTYHPGATQQWTFEEPAGPPAPGHDVTGQWSIPVAGGDLPDESGEFTTSSLVEQWGGTPPATLPGGAPAPWATESAGQPWGQPEAAPRQGEPAEASLPGHAPAHPGPDMHPADPSAAPASEGFAPRAAYTESPAEHAPGPAPETGPAPAPAGDEHPAPAPSGGHSPAQAPEGPADGPAAHDGADEPEAAPKAAGTAVTPDTPGPADTATAPGTAGPRGTAAAHDAEASADPPGPADPPEASETHHTPDDPAAQAAPEQDASEDPAPAALPPNDDHPLASYVLRVNGTDRPVTDAWIGESLLYVLRERLGLAGAKDGCSQGECGACNVQVDGRLVASCLVPAVTAAGAEVRTVEGLAADGQPSDVQRALARCGAVQCGFCVPGMAMTVHDLLEGNPAPTELETRQALCGNLCRCSGYRGVLDAVQEVVAEREAHTAAEAETDGNEARIPHQAGPGSGGVNPSAFEVPGVFDSPGTFGTPGPHDQHYGQDGGQA